MPAAVGSGFYKRPPILGACNCSFLARLRKTVQVSAAVLLTKSSRQRRFSGAFAIGLSAAAGGEKTALKRVTLDPGLLFHKVWRMFEEIECRGSPRFQPAVSQACSLLGWPNLSCSEISSDSFGSRIGSVITIKLVSAASTLEACATAGWKPALP